MLNDHQMTKREVRIGSPDTPIRNKRPRARNCECMSDRPNGTARNADPRNGTARNADPRNGTERHADPRNGTERHADPRNGTPIHGTARRSKERHADPRHGTPIQGTTRHGTPIQGTERNGTARHGTERNGSDRGDREFGSDRGDRRVGRVGMSHPVFWCDRNATWLANRQVNHFSVYNTVCVFTFSKKVNSKKPSNRQAPFFYILTWLEMTTWNRECVSGMGGSFSTLFSFCELFHLNFLFFFIFRTKTSNTSTHPTHATHDTQIAVRLLGDPSTQHPPRSTQG